MGRLLFLLFLLLFAAPDGPNRELLLLVFPVIMKLFWAGSMLAELLYELPPIRLPPNMFSPIELL